MIILKVVATLKGLKKEVDQFWKKGPIGMLEKE
jgi:hypothetical protein